MLRKLLALGGGGVMGRAQVEILAANEQQTGMPTYKTYGLISGSSVGAIHAAFLATGKMSAFEIAQKEDEMMKRIFGHKKFFPNFYDTQTFVKIWDELIGNDFLFGDVKTKLMISSVERCENRTVFFKSWEEQEATVKLVDIVCRSFAAPLYFGQINDEVNQRVYFDGGMGEYNLPIEEVKFEAELNGWYDGDDKILIDAIGACYTKISEPYDKVSHEKFLRQCFGFMAPADGGMARVQAKNDQVRKMVKLAQTKKNISFRYWDCCIPEKMIGMDKIKLLSFYRDSGRLASAKPIEEVINF